MCYLQNYMFQKAKEIYLKEFYMIMNKNEAKTMEKYMSCDSKSKCNSTTCNIAIFCIQFY